MSGPKIILALDYSDSHSALSMADQIDPAVVRVKVGKELFTRAGPDVVKALTSRGFDVFLDLKYHDIPHTVGRACAAAADLGVWMMNVHALGGMAMMQAAREAIGNSEDAPRLIAVTLLTSMDQQTFDLIGLSGTMAENVLRLASLAKASGLDGVVCSAQEASTLREKLGVEFQLITPGIRPVGSSPDDQNRTMTPSEAIAAGSHYLVIGRPVTAAADPMQALREISQSLN